MNVPSLGQTLRPNITTPREIVVIFSCAYSRVVCDDIGPIWKPLLGSGTAHTLAKRLCGNILSPFIREWEWAVFLNKIGDLLQWEYSSQANSNLPKILLDSSSRVEEVRGDWKSDSERIGRRKGLKEKKVCNRWIGANRFDPRRIQHTLKFNPSPKQWDAEWGPPVLQLVDYCAVEDGQC